MTEHELDRRRLLSCIGAVGTTALAGGAGSAAARGGRVQEDGRGERGDTIWRVGGGYGTAATVVGEGLYVSRSDGCYRMDAGTGTLDWAFTLDQNGGFAGTPEVVGGTVYAPIRRRDANDNIVIHALDAATGEEQWQYETDAGNLGVTTTSGTVYAGNVALDAATGEERWTADVSGEQFGPTVVDGTAYVSTRNDGLFALDAATGEEQWQFADADFAAATVADGTVYTGGDTPYALDAATGEPVWSGGLGEDRAPVPTVADGVAYYVGGLRAHALDAATGEPVWRFDPPEDAEYFGGGDAPATVVGDTVYVPSSFTETVFALDAASGDPRWSVAIEGLEPSGPIVVDGILYTAAGRGVRATATDTPGSSSGSRVAQATDNHHHTWAGESAPSIDTTPPTSGPGSRRWLGATVETVPGSSPTFYDGLVYVTDGAGTTYAFDGSGTEQWRFEGGGRSAAAPTVVAGRLFAAAGRTLYWLDPATGEEQLSASLPHLLLNSPTATGRHVYALTRAGTLVAFDAATAEEAWRVEKIGRFNREQATLGGSPTVVEGAVVVPASVQTRAFDPATGEELWTTDKGGSLRVSPTVADGTVYTGGEDGLHALDLETGKRQWLAETGQYRRASPTVADGTVYAASGDEVRAHDAASGELQWSFPTRGTVASSPTVAGDTVVVGGGDGTVYALDAATGESRWQHVAGGTVGSSPTVADGTAFVGTDDGLVALRAGADRSTGSRVALGTLGHHGDWATRGAALGATPTPSPSPTESSGGTGGDDDASPSGTTAPGGSGGSSGGDGTGGDGTDAGTSSGAGPGFGVLTTLAAGALAGWRLLGDDGTED